MEVINNIPFDLNVDLLVSRLSLSRVHLDKEKELQKLIDSLALKVKPRAVYKTCFVNKKNYDTLDINGILFKSRILRVNLDKAEKVFTYIVTCGHEFDEMFFSVDDTLEKYYLNEAGNIIISTAQEYIDNIIKNKYVIPQTARMSPGSLQDWPLEQQNQLFSTFGASNVKRLIGVSLTENFLMQPSKTISGIIFPNKTSFKSCQLCPRKSCPGRKAPYDKTLLAKYFDE